jgi:hypothetical protein
MEARHQCRDFQMSGEEQKRKMNAERSRRRRERKREGRMCIQIEVDWDDIDALHDNEFLDSWNTPDREEIEIAIREMLEELKGRHA